MHVCVSVYNARKYHENVRLLYPPGRSLRRHVSSNGWLVCMWDSSDQGNFASFATLRRVHICTLASLASQSILQVSSW